MINVDNLDVIKITTGDSVDLYPAWSPDGSQIVYSSDGDIYTTTVGDVSGSSINIEARLTSGQDFDYGPAWSPDGNHIAFVRNTSIYVMNSDGGGMRKITVIPDRLIVVGQLDWR